MTQQTSTRGTSLITARVRQRLANLAGFALIAWTAGACDATGTETGSVRVLLESEDVITSGIEAGDTPDSIRDGWSMRYSKFIVAIGHIEVHLATSERETAQASEIYAVDLTRLPATGVALWELADLAAGRWEFSFETPAAGPDTVADDNVEAQDFMTLVDEGLTYLIEGTLTNETGQSCPPRALAEPGEHEPNGNSSGGNPCYDAPEVEFAFGTAAQTLFGPCELDGVSGFSVTANARQTVAATLHGDHLFFNGFPEGGEGGVMRLAQWLADCDLNLDGRVTREELAAIHPSALPEIDDRFQLGGSPVTPIETMLDYLRGQLMTQGHMNGEGECAYNKLAPHDH